MIRVVGAGFAGLTLAHELVKAGFEVEVFEKAPRGGGLISTLPTERGLVETAANALLADRNIEELFADLDLKFAARSPLRTKRYIYWNKPRRWPLGAWTTARLLLQAWRLRLGGASILPRPEESVSDWAKRFGGETFEARLLVPALQGVYAGDPRRLSARLIMGSLLEGRPPRGLHKGSVAPERGMGALMEALVARLTESGRAQLHFDRAFESDKTETEANPTVICTSAWQAAEILKTSRPELSRLLQSCESLPLISATGFFKPQGEELKGFGCLFPKSQGFSALGVLFNATIFEGRSQQRSETWILGGAQGRDLISLSDDELIERLMEDRSRLNGQASAPALSWSITRWERAIPHYTLEWARILKDLHAEPPLFLHGNYLGELGLARMYARSRRLATDLKVRYG